ncbi:MAG: erythromycin esterase family protein [Colwellia sp.]|nr:erythromycin esterase family protein [Colwellia sp.]
MLKKTALATFYTLTLFIFMACDATNVTDNATATSRQNIKISEYHQSLISHTIEINTKEGLLSQTDLSKFAESLGDARIVGLGEQTHGAGSVFTLKVQLIKYLHEHHDFDVFILESGMFDVKKIWEQAQAGQRIKDIAPGNIFYMYAKTAEVTPLFDYINQQMVSEQPLVLLGFDSQHTGGISNKGLVEALANAVARSSMDISQDAEWSVLSRQIQHVLDVNNTRFTGDIEKIFFQQLSNLQQVFLMDANLDVADSRFWYRITKGLEAQAKRQWKIADHRSQEMGENIKYWAEQYPDKKIIVWAHTWHLTRDGSYQINAGQVVAKAYGNKYFMTHFTGAAGEYLDFVTMKNKTIITDDNNSFESLLSGHTKEDIGFLNLKQFNKDNKKTVVKDTLIFSNNYQQTLSIDQSSTFFDGIFFIKNIEAASFQE